MINSHESKNSFTNKFLDAIELFAFGRDLADWSASHRSYLKCKYRYTPEEGEREIRSDRISNAMVSIPLALVKLSAIAIAVASTTYVIYALNQSSEENDQGTGDNQTTRVDSLISDRDR
ncbi:hypothetical protein [Cerasicoccus frondis]|uniref:hypothetical protein n=1 Tax=Cerasicoccus frondis TaxID=490090 RepID=UPI00285258E8|nr:hypothetical protein [Cerasicoccus frondis]